MASPCVRTRRLSDGGILVKHQDLQGPSDHAGWFGRAVRAPSLLDRYDPERGDGVSVTLDADSSTVILAVHGSWGIPLRFDTHAAIRKCLSEHPGALVIDLADLQDPHATSSSLWLTARRAGAAMDPPVEVVVCTPPATATARLLRRLGARFLPVFATAAQAGAAVAERLPLTDRIKLSLPADPGSAARIRAAVTDACAAWGLPDLADRARLIGSELVANAVQHGQPPITAFVSRRGRGLHIAVRDADPRLPRRLDVHPTPSAPLPPAGLGLTMVHAAASFWGAMPTSDGKVVWATVRAQLSEDSRRVSAEPGS